MQTRKLYVPEIGKKIQVKLSTTALKTIDKKEIAEGLWVKCPLCNQVIYQRELEKNQHVCRSCSHHFRMSSNNYFSLLLDDNENEKIGENIRPTDPLQFPGKSELYKNIFY